MNLVVLGLSLSSSWGNGHATTYRALLRAFAARGHSILFLERDVPWYAVHRDLPHPRFARLGLYRTLHELKTEYAEAVRRADAVIVGSFVPDGVAVGDWALRTARGVVAFYDIDTPVTLARLAAGSCDYLAAEQIARYHLYLSFTGGPTLTRLESEFGAPRARPLYCAVDPGVHSCEPQRAAWDLGYIGTYSADRQPALEDRLLRAARLLPQCSFVVAGPQYPASLDWPANVQHLEHVAPGEHARFYSRQRFTLNLTRTDMARAGYSPSVRLFEAAACGTPVITDAWPGLEAFFAPDREILVATSGDDVVRYLRELSPDQARAIGAAARGRILREHTATHRARELEALLAEALQPTPADAP